MTFNGSMFAFKKYCTLLRVFYTDVALCTPSSSALLLPLWQEKIKPSYCDPPTLLQNFQLTYIFKSVDQA